MDAYRGQLFVEGKKDGLAAAISIDGNNVRVVTGDDVWTWPIKDVTATRVDTSRFNLALADEEFVFVADNPVIFTFEIAENLNNRNPGRKRPRRRPRGRRNLSRRSARPIQSEKALQSSPTIARPDVWTKLASGTDEASLFQALTELTEHHVHRWDLGDEEGGAQTDKAVTRCADCAEVFVDLIAAERSDDEPTGDAQP